MLESQAFQIVPFVEASADPNERDPPDADPHFQIPSFRSLTLVGKNTTTKTRQDPLLKYVSERDSLFKV
jgi:hypothetical protein